MSENSKIVMNRYIQMFDRAHDKIKEEIYIKNNRIAMELLQECQEGAIQVGSLIEQIKGKGFVTVGILEEYCEKIYRLYAELDQDNFIGIEEKCSQIAEVLSRIRDSVEKDFVTKKEAVFLPYKACMWDSMESVWKAACKDEEYDVAVIPIPYYDKNPDGSFGNMHYEGNEFPDYVPIIDYNQYDFENRHPDIIVIHNPYDNNNYVTSVHPFFYSKNIKKFTDQLIYIPYFVLDDMSTENEDWLNNLEHFVAVPAVIYSDKVIVQSEMMRKAYIQILTGMAGEKSRSMWEEKILGLGSPKYDKVNSTMKDNIQIPAEWMQLMKKQDGSSKKVILYNTSVTALLENGKKMLEKIQSTFQVFRENQDHVTLLWRPHPLIKATISSMHPELLKPYIEIVEKYKKDGWGIYDDSSELDRAIAMSDAYFGDASSLVQLCNKVEMPIMIQNITKI